MNALDNDINDLCSELVSALGAWERGEPGAEARHQLLLERLEGMGRANCGSAQQATKPRHLRLVWSRPE